MNISRGLIIADPWIGHILDGHKDWEMRSQPTSHRGWFGLIRKGSGLVVGVAKLVDCGLALSPEEMIEAYRHHLIPRTLIKSGQVSKWVIPWKLSDIRRLDRPVAYEHKSGAVTWVTFSETVSDQLKRELGRGGSNSEVGDEPTFAARKIDQTKPVTTASPETKIHTSQGTTKPPKVGVLETDSWTLLGRSRLSGGNLRNNHFYLTDFLEKFPADAVGGRNTGSAAPRTISIDWGGAAPVSSDIDQTKRMFRKRGWVRHFFEASGAREGDSVVVTASSPYSVHVRLIKEKCLD